MGHVYTPSQKYLFGPQFDEKRMMDAVVAENDPDKRRVKRHESCGAFPVVRLNPETGMTSLGCNWCEYRTCPRCRRAHQSEVSAALAQWIGHPGRNEWRFITLTLQHSEEPLKEKLDHLRASFKRLRQHKIWKDSQTYGKGVIEIAFNNETGRWHPHLHIISRGDFIGQRILSEAWSVASRGSRIVDIRILKSERACAGYVSKYLGKPPNLEGVADPLRILAEYYIALRNAKLIISFGDGPPLPKPQKSQEYEENLKKQVILGPLHVFLAMARDGSTLAKAVLHSLENHTPLDPALVPDPNSCHDPPTPPGHVPVPTKARRS